MAVFCVSLCLPEAELSSVPESSADQAREYGMCIILESVWQFVSVQVPVCMDGACGRCTRLTWGGFIIIFVRGGGCICVCVCA